MEKIGSEGTIWTCFLYVPLRISTARLLTWVLLKCMAIKCSYQHLHPSSYPNSFLMCKLHHHPTCSTMARSNIRSSDSSAARVAVARAWIIRGNQLSIMNKYSPTERQTYAPTDLSLSPAHHPATRGCGHILGPDKCDHNVSCTLGHACAKEPLCN